MKRREEEEAEEEEEEEEEEGEHTLHENTDTFHPSMLLESRWWRLPESVLRGEAQLAAARFCY